MDDPRPDSPDAVEAAQPHDEPIPLGQRLYDSPFLLLLACILVMFLFFTGWGVIEILSLTEAPLP